MFPLIKPVDIFKHQEYFWGGDILLSISQLTIKDEEEIFEEADLETMTEEGSE